MRKCGIIYAPALYDLYAQVASRYESVGHLLRGFGLALNKRQRNWSEEIEKIRVCMIPNGINLRRPSMVDMALNTVWKWVDISHVNMTFVNEQLTTEMHRSFDA